MIVLDSASRDRSEPGSAATGLMLRRWGFPTALAERVELAAQPEGDALPAVAALLVAGLYLQDHCRAGGQGEASVDAFLRTHAAERLDLTRRQASQEFYRFPEAFEHALA